MKICFCIKANFHRIDNKCAKGYDDIEKEVEEKSKAFISRRYWIKFYHDGRFYKRPFVSLSVIEQLNNLDINFKHLLKFKENYSTDDYICSIVAKNPKEEDLDSINLLLEYLYNNLDGEHIVFFNELFHSIE